MKGINTRLDFLNEKNETIICQFQLSNFLNQFESLKNEINETIVFCNLEIFKINLFVSDFWCYC